MRVIVGLIFSLSLVAGCGGNMMTNNCGATGQACCANNACSGGDVCMGGTCVAMGSCGTMGKMCCANNMCTDGSTCTAGVCAAAPCGGSGQACCTPNSTCNNGLTCTAGTCGTPGADTGEACAKPTDCAGTKPTCVTKDSQGVAWPGGYCTSSCNPQKNDPTSGLNTACPGGNGTCLGAGTTGSCETACSAGTCARQGYSCFQSCEPTARSQCNPTMKLSCPQDGGAAFNLPPTDGGTDDAGALVTAPRNCARTGADNVGQCTDGCDPLYPQMVGMPSPPCKATEGCYPSYETGLGTCFQTVGGGGEGTPCVFLNNCDPGFACRTVGNMHVCRAMCGGPNNVACPMNEMCTDLSTQVKKAVLGGCN